MFQEYDNSQILSDVVLVFANMHILKVCSKGIKQGILGYHGVL